MLGTILVMVIEKTKIVFMMTVENLHGREVLSQFLKYNIPIQTIIIEHKSAYAENARNYLKNDFYNLESLEKIINEKKIKTHYVENHNDDQTFQLLEEYKPDYIVLGGARILKEHIIKTARFGILNSHPAILPKYRGLDCVAWSILDEDHVGATVHFIDVGVDSGPIIIQDTVNYSDCDSLLKVRIKVMRKCAELMVRGFLGIYFNTIKTINQDSSKGINHVAIETSELSLVKEKIMKQYKKKSSKISN
jgi:methionyl-tRNA formyltransferase